MELTVWQAVVLGLVEGITEYLPVSSTGHLILAQAALSLGKDEPARRAVNDFAVIIQGGAILAVVGLYWSRMVQMLRGLRGLDAAGFRIFTNLVIAFVPSAILGLLLDDWIDAKLFGVEPVVVALLVGGAYMILVERWHAGAFALPRFHARANSIEHVTPLQALGIGLLQCFALWPGTSRSMMTITGGYLVGLRPAQAAEFSFLLGLPTLLAATIYKLAKNLWQSHRDGTDHVFARLGWGPSLLGILVAALAAALAVKWLVGFLNRRGLAPFGWYRIALALILGVAMVTGVVAHEPRRSFGPPRPVPPVEFEPAAPEHGTAPPERAP